jgi:hypothetical protein
MLQESTMALGHRGLWIGFIALAWLSACGRNSEFIAVDPPPATGRPIGDVCIVDTDCEGGRCVAGVCGTNECAGDDDCRPDEICVLGACEPADDFACAPGQAPIISLSTTSVEFPPTPVGETVEEIITVTNIGTCLLTIANASFASGSDSEFACDGCDARTFPQRVPPQRSTDLALRYAPTEAGEKIGVLEISSDDRTAGSVVGDRGIIAVDVHASNDGSPVLVASPIELNFGFVPFSAGGVGGTVTNTVELTNRGSGVAPLEVTRLFMDRDRQFQVTGVAFASGSAVVFDSIDPDAPLVIPPYDANDPATVVVVSISFTPDSNANFQDELVIRTSLGDTETAVVAMGSSLGPPAIEVTPTSALVFGGPQMAALTLGTVDFQQVFVRNNGQSDLVVNYQISGGAEAASQFSVTPSFVPAIAPGGSVVLSVFFNPTTPSDPVNQQNPATALNAALNITSNDTDPAADVLKVVPLTGYARSSIFDDILTVEMTYENADNSWAGSDFRDVDLVVENQSTGFICQEPLYIQAADGTLQIQPGGNYCETWSNTANQGSAAWLSLGQFEEPERVILSGLGPDNEEGARYSVRVFYKEDCANIPTGLLADILGIAGSVLLGVLGGAVGVPIAVPPENISQTIANNCFDRASSLTTVQLRVTGEVVGSPQVRLGSKGASCVIANFRRDNGQFVYEPLSSPECIN